MRRRTPICGTPSFRDQLCNTHVPSDGAEIEAQSKDDLYRHVDYANRSRSTCSRQAQAKAGCMTNQGTTPRAESSIALPRPTLRSIGLFVTSPITIRPCLHYRPMQIACCSASAGNGTSGCLLMEWSGPASCPPGSDAAIGRLSN